MIEQLNQSLLSYFGFESDELNRLSILKLLSIQAPKTESTPSLFTEALNTLALSAWNCAKAAIETEGIEADPFLSAALAAIQDRRGSSEGPENWAAFAERLKQTEEVLNQSVSIKAIRTVRDHLDASAAQQAPEAAAMTRNEGPEVFAPLRSIDNSGAEAIEGILTDLDAAQKNASEKLKESIDAAQSLLNVEAISIELGSDLIPLASDMIELLGKIREQVAKEIGLILPGVHLRDNLSLEPGDYRFLMREQLIDSWNLNVDALLAISQGGSSFSVEQSVKEPCFGIDAWWIKPSDKENAQSKGMAVVRPIVALSIHFTEIIKKNLHQFFGHAELEFLMGGLEDRHLRMAVEKNYSNPKLLLLFKGLLKERCSIRDAKTILEVIDRHADRASDTGYLITLIRQAFIPATMALLAQDGTLFALSLSAKLKQELVKSLQYGAGEVSLELSASRLRELKAQFLSHEEHHTLVLITTVLLRSPLKKALRSVELDIPILSDKEIANDIELVILGTLGE